MTAFSDSHLDPLRRTHRDLCDEAQHLAWLGHCGITDESRADLANHLGPLTDALLAFRRASIGPAVFYDRPGQEYLNTTTIDDAVLAALTEDYETPEDYPETLTIMAYHRQTPSNGSIAHPGLYSPLISLLEQLDEDHRGPDKDPTEPTPEMRAAETAFINTVLLQYTSFWCDHSTTITIDVRRWLNKNCPDLLPKRSHTTQICGHCHQPRGTQEMLSCTACHRRGCSRCWRTAARSTSPWPRRAPRPNSCGFRLPEHLEAQKVRDQYQRRTAELGWGKHTDGPIDAQ